MHSSCFRSLYSNLTLAELLVYLSCISLISSSTYFRISSHESCVCEVNSMVHVSRGGYFKKKEYMILPGYIWKQRKQMYLILVSLNCPTIRTVYPYSWQCSWLSLQDEVIINLDGTGGSKKYEVLLHPITQICLLIFFILTHSNCAWFKLVLLPEQIYFLPLRIYFLIVHHIKQQPDWLVVHVSYCN